MVARQVAAAAGIPSPAEVWLNLEILCKVFFWIDFGSPGSTLSESAGCTPGTLERFEKFKMASKMAAVSDNSL